MKVAALLSGGVDSSVALLRALEAGHEVSAFYLKVWLENDFDLDLCPWEEDIEYARAVADRLGVALEIIPLQQEYQSRILKYTLDQVARGFTPNPDMLCNNHIKFGAFLDGAGSGFDLVVSGHYAATNCHARGTQLLEARDSFKDQTYFLARLGQNQLARAFFPLGKLLKQEVRQIAQHANLPTWRRKDSQGLCFLGKISFRDFIKARLGEKKGFFIEKETGSTIGEHNGNWFYTAGQRRGLGLSGGPWYVVNRSAERNEVYISRNYFSEEKARNRFTVSDLHWILDKPDLSQEITVKLRHGEERYVCLRAEESLSGQELAVTIQGKDQGIAPGQFAVFYARGECLGSGIIQAEIL